MTDLVRIVTRLEEAGGTLLLEGNRICYSIPKGDTEALGLLAELRKHREQLKDLLVQRAAQQDGWPPESPDEERRFGLPHARVFPFLGRKVRTPKGPGTLLQVFTGRVTVLLDTDMNKCSFFSPTEIRPVSPELNP